MLNARPAPPDADLGRAADEMKKTAQAALRVKAGEDPDRVYESLAGSGIRREALDDMTRTFDERQLREFIATDQVARFHQKERERARRSGVLRKIHERLLARAGGSEERYAREEQAFWDEIIRSSGTVTLDPRFPIPTMKGVLRSHAAEPGVSRHSHHRR